MNQQSNSISWCYTYHSFAVCFTASSKKLNNGLFWCHDAAYLCILRFFLLFILQADTQCPALHQILHVKNNKTKYLPSSIAQHDGKNTALACKSSAPSHIPTTSRFLSWYPPSPSFTFPWNNTPWLDDSTQKWDMFFPHVVNLDQREKEVGKIHLNLPDCGGLLQVVLLSTHPKPWVVVYLLYLITASFEMVNRTMEIALRCITSSVAVVPLFPSFLSLWPAPPNYSHINPSVLCYS